MRDHDEEVAWQQREITGSTLLLCEQCGRPLNTDGGDVVTLAEATSPLAEPIEGQRICADCYARIGRGEAEADAAWEDDEVTGPS